LNRQLRGIGRDHLTGVNGMIVKMPAMDMPVKVTVETGMDAPMR
jgi:hypothetical protein